jgi:hypothetical protein
MRNTFMNALQNEFNYNYTTNGALAHKTTRSKVYDMFALGGAYRQRSDSDCILLFKEAYDENPTLAVKCLFYLRDCRGGQGERRFFRVCFNWLCKSHSDHARRLLTHVSEYGRWDDLIYSTMDTSLEKDMLKIIDDQLTLDLDSKTPSLLAKWMPSENASSYKTQMAARRIIKSLGGQPKYYRKALSVLRKRINIVERLMSENRWEEIEFDKIPSKAGLIYKNAFARRDIIAKKYEKFAKSETTTVNAKTLYPYEVVRKVTEHCGYNGLRGLSDTDRAMINKYWANLPDYFEGAPASMMCVVDTSGSMTWGGGQVTPIDVAISLGLYCAERMSGPFAGNYISFASRPQLIETRGIDFCDKVHRIYKTNLCDNTNLVAVFDMLLNTIESNWEIRESDIPKTIVVISDMQIDSGVRFQDGGYYRGSDANQKLLTEMESVRQKWTRRGHKMPNLVYWNVNATNDTFLDLGPGVSYCSGCSPTLFKQVITGKTGYDLMMDVLMNKRYEVIQ